MAPSPEPIRNSLTLRVDLSEVSRARRLVSQLASEAGFAGERCYDIQVASSEATANAIEHSPLDAEVEFAVTVLADRLEVQVEGRGQFELPAVAARERVHRGLGLPLMAKLSDHLSLYSGPHGGTLVALTFYRPGFADPRPNDATPPSIAELVEENEVVSAILSSITDEVWYADADKKFTLANAAAIEEFGALAPDGVSVEELAERTEVYRPDMSLRPIDEAPPLRALAGEVVRDQEEIVRTPGSGELRHRLVSAAPVRDVAGHIIGAVSTVRDITESKQIERQLRAHDLVMAGIGKILEAALRTGGEVQLGDVCLEVAEEITGSKFGFIGEFGPDGRLFDMTISDPGGDDCQIRNFSGRQRPLGDFKVHGIHGRVLADGRSLFTNDPASHADGIGLPVGHPSLTAFLGVPLKREGETIGLIAVGNREGGYGPEQVEALESLAPTIVEAFSRKRAEGELQRKEEEARLLLRGAPAAIFEIDFHGPTFVSVNDWICEQTGYSREELLEMSPYALLDEESQARFRQRIELALAGESPKDIVEYSGFMKDGRKLTFVLNTSLIYEDGKPVRALVAGHDVTERRRVEEAVKSSDDRLAFALGVSGTGAWDLDLVDHTAHRSVEHDRTFGYESLLPEWTYEMFLDHVIPEDRAMVDAKFQAAMAGRTDWNFDCRIRRVDGEIRWIWAAGRHQLGDHERWRMAGIVQDITERKLVEEALRDSEERFRLMFERHGAVMLIIDPTTGAIVDGNAAAADFYGYSRDELCSLSIHDLNQLPPDQVAAEYQKAAAEERSHFEFPHLAAGGETRWVDVHSVPIEVQGRTLLFSIIQDVTERKRAEKALTQSEATLRGILDSATESIWLYTPDGVALGGNELAFRRLGRTAEQVVGRHMSELASADVIEPRLARLRQVAESCRSVEFEDERAGMVFHHTFCPVVDDEGHVERIAIFSRDITESRRAEEEREMLLAEEQQLAEELAATNEELQSQAAELQATNEQLREAEAESASLFALVVGASDDAIVTETLEGVIASWNEAAEATYGYSAAEVVGRPLAVLACPDRPHEMGEILRRIGKGERIDHLETVWMSKGGRQIDVSLTVSPIYDAGGGLIGASSIIRDMTGRRQAERALVESQRLLSSIVNSTSDMVWSVDPRSFGLLSFNQGLRNHFLDWRGLSIDVGMRPEDLYPSDDFIQEWRGLYRRALSEGPYMTEFRVYAGTHMLELSFNPLEREGEVFGISVFGKDITAQRQAENERALAREKELAAGAYARGLIEASLDALVTISPDGKITDVNEATVKITGRKREDLIGTDFSDYFTDPEAARGGYLEVFAKGQVTDYPLTVQAPRGRLTDVLYNASVYRDESGNVLGVFAAARDISQLKELEVQRQIASTLQDALLDIPRELPGVEFGQLYRSATQRAQVGGDFYDAFETRAGRIALLIGDVSGHGLEAARVATLVKDVVHAFAHQFRRPHLVLRETNRLLVGGENLAGFVTAFLAFLDPETGTLVYSSAGHPPPLLLADRKAEPLISASLPLGVFADARYKDVEIVVPGGALLLLYTDGITEARRNGDIFGEARLAAALAKMGNRPIQKLPSSLLEAALRFSGGALRDDVALLDVKYRGKV